jgi:hypothetical protein
MDDRILEAYEETILNEQVNPKDPSGEREGFVQMVGNRVATLVGYGVLDRSEAKKISDFVKKTIKF